MVSDFAQPERGQRTVALMKSRERTGQLTTTTRSLRPGCTTRYHTASSERLQMLLQPDRETSRKRAPCRRCMMQGQPDGGRACTTITPTGHWTTRLSTEATTRRWQDEKGKWMGAILLSIPNCCNIPLVRILIEIVENYVETTCLSRLSAWQRRKDIHEHYTNAYHETPLHKFYMNNKQVRDDRFRQESIDAHYDTELKRKDGVKVNAHVERKTNIDSSRLQHVDELNIKAMPKAHPEQVTRVNLRARILDRDHVLLNQHNLKNTVVTMPDGGKRTVSMKEDRVVLKNLKTTPLGKPGLADDSLPVSQQVHNAEKIVVPADAEAMTPFTHHYKMKRDEKK
ncbi:hypothetical protein LSTR_LSTR007887 [Laodelphax striatellus]|uniref:Uncharacterized protein n=1 Tax=Laodelphax striatellus TaxID=195883 RepID=A0A482XQY5_LAOST|nr:hypothetical protein LSTR_LSTR007887 [Laodelphax striatellus]